MIDRVCDYTRVVSNKTIFNFGIGLYIICLFMELIRVLPAI